MVIAVDMTVAPPAVRLEEPDAFDRFSIVVHGSAEPAAVTAELGRIGWPADVDHFFVEPESLRALAGPRAEDAVWREKLDAMLAYATSKGWTDDAGRVRAHVERCE